MINLIDIERRYHHLEGDFCDITSCISLWGILRKNLRKRSTYINVQDPRSKMGDTFARMQHFDKVTIHTNYTI